MTVYKTKYDGLRSWESHDYNRRNELTRIYRNNEVDRFIRDRREYGPQLPPPAREARSFKVPVRQVDLVRVGKTWLPITEGQIRKAERFRRMGEAMVRYTPRFRLPLLDALRVAEILDRKMEEFERDHGGGLHTRRLKGSKVAVPSTSGFVLKRSCDLVFTEPGPEVWDFFPGKSDAGCIGGQAYSMGPMPSSVDVTLYVGESHFFVNGEYARMGYERCYWKTGTAVSPFSRPVTGRYSPVPGGDRFGLNGLASPMLNPNAHRLLSHATSRNTTPRTIDKPRQVSEPVIPYQRTEISSVPPGLRPPRTEGYTPHRPPNRRTREGKTMAEDKKWLVRALRALDLASEGAEVVDAFYRALPADVQRRWGKGRDERPGDQMGQYGADGADWKLQALYHNWDKVDFSAALTNIMQNEIEDRLYGLAHSARDRLRPRNYRREFGS